MIFQKVLSLFLNGGLISDQVFLTILLLRLDKHILEDQHIPEHLLSL